MTQLKTTANPEAAIKLMNLNYTLSAVSLLGGIGGIVYSNRTGGGFWRGVGYFILGNIALGAVATIATSPMRSKILKDGLVTDITGTVICNDGTTKGTSSLTNNDPCANNGGIDYNVQIF